MAIKTQVSNGVRRVITKVTGNERKVSCSCCEGAGCCMYPADQIGVSYNFEDLPDEVLNVSEFSYAKVVSPETYLLQNNQSATLYYGLSGEGYVVTNGRWGFDQDGVVSTTDECLFADGVNTLAQDNFADTYTVAGVDEVEIIVERQSLCLWSGQTNVDLGFAIITYTASLQYQGGDGDEFFGGIRDKWFVISDVTGGGGGGAGVKLGNQNTPIGTYAPPLGPDYIVSE